jgi:hypothetical protein
MPDPSAVIGELKKALAAALANTANAAIAVDESHGADEAASIKPNIDKIVVAIDRLIDIKIEVALAAASRRAQDQRDRRP